MKLAIVDDIPEEASLIQEHIREFLPLADISCFTTTADFSAKWKPNNYDLIILDIFIDEHTGIELAKEIRKSDNKTALAFCSTSNEFASESYEVNAVYYITKPINQNKIYQMLQRINPSKLEEIHTVLLPNGKEIFPGQIVRTDYFNHVVTIHFKKDPPMNIRISQAELEQLLLPYNFFSPNRGSLINLKAVHDFLPESFQMIDGSLVPISRRRKKEAEEAYLSFRFQKLIKELKE